ncbi:hypothetical protein D910_04389 [Dendroctonus ponderosae]|uniref:Aromatic-L-amino-acid decarboxylase n=1 Tax=Dendroctonus ponderosae TaxID=77166 RepID=U4U8Q9_DENPD|nr:hypothetical protein D910_04389 [Dendroctonus ponderosae]
MDAEQFREFGKAAVDYIADYYETIRDRPVLSNVEPGYLGDLLPKDPPQSGESWRDVLEDVDRIIMPGITHWHSPHFHAYYPTAQSFPSVVGELMSAGFGVVGLSWIASPAMTELEVVMMNWLGRMLGLPEQFLNCSEGPGGGVIQGSASESTYIGLLAAKDKKVRELMETNPSLTEAEIKGKLVAYSSDQSNSSVEKAGLLGTTPTCAFDNLEELGPVCNKENIWLHIDAAYAGSAFICPEYRHLMKGAEMADSFNFNPHKWLMVNFDCSAMWVRDAQYLVEAFNVERIYLKDQHKGLAPEYRHWQIALGRRFRALKLWFVLRIYGVEGLQKHIRGQIALAEYLSDLVKSDNRFELCTCSMGLVTFRLKGEDSLTEKLLEDISKKKELFLVAGHMNHKLVVRYAICSRLTEKRDVDFSWRQITETAEQIIPTPKKSLTKSDKQIHPVLNINCINPNLEKSK